MKIRDANASIEGDLTTMTMTNAGLEILGDDGRTLYAIKLDKGTLQVTAGPVCKVDGVVLNDSLTIVPRASNCVFIQRPMIDSSH